MQHVYPINDLKPHETEGTSCHCNPSVDWENEIVIHKAFDHREVIEEAEEILNECANGMKK